MRIATHRFIVVFSMALTAALTLGALSQNVVAQEATSPDENLKQIALTDAQIESFIGAQKEMVPIVAKAPQGDQPDPKVMEQLEEVVKKYKLIRCESMRQVGYHMRSYDAPQGLAAMRGTRPEARPQHYER
jgi:hypothetical protein